MNITFEPISCKGQLQIARVLVDARDAFVEWTRFPNPFDFKASVEVRYLLELYNTSLQTLKAIMSQLEIVQFEPMKNPYGEGYWVWLNNLDDGVKVWKKLSI